MDRSQPPIASGKPYVRGIVAAHGRGNVDGEAGAVAEIRYRIGDLQRQRGRGVVQRDGHNVATLKRKTRRIPCTVIRCGTIDKQSRVADLCVSEAVV